METNTAGDKAGDLVSMFNEAYYAPSGDANNTYNTYTGYELYDQLDYALRVDNATTATADDLAGGRATAEIATS
eukprot:CAMPEP_0197606586 /NCGR_PEP_ID=MMETSP1326-20131121/45395_1 /TAXON_ID=1155430 /ORGANISM="Genus nov. species nov., Strain RCC2288" /LENGTH=73 /DNA_ID=CAMNT_0043174517 /DNA_START=86 /DNA_END=307 /DNA_ORIENTATION=-